MKSKRMLLLCAVFQLVFLCTISYGSGLWIDNFDNPGQGNMLGGGLGAWDRDPEDVTQYCRESYSSNVKLGASGYSLRLEYDVDSPQPAYNGFWTKLNKADFSGCEKIVFWLKADDNSGGSEKIKVELKNEKGESGAVMVSGVSKKWKRYEVRLKDFWGLTDFKSMSEFVLVFEDKNAVPKKGVIYLDDVYVGNPFKEANTKLAEVVRKDLKADVTETDEGLLINMKQSVNFASGKSEISMASYYSLDKLFKILESNNNYNIKIKGHTDSLGNSSYNRILSQERAEVVADYLMSRGIKSDRIVDVIGAGDSEPVADNGTIEGRRANRRTEIILVK